jgi:hypothetical protein
MNSSGVVYRPRENATPEAELSALCDAYRFILKTEKKGGPATAPDDPNKDKDARTYSHST